MKNLIIILVVVLIVYYLWEHLILRIQSPLQPVNDLLSLPIDVRIADILRTASDQSTGGTGGVVQLTLQIV